MNNKTNIKLKLEEDFLKKLRMDIENEIEIASKKWRVQLNSEDKNSIVTHSFNQLFQKVTEISKNSWTGGNVINVKVHSVKEIPDINLSSKSKTKSDLNLFKLRDRWEFSSEDVDGLIPLEVFYDHFITKVRQWARTAAFYGVSSHV